VTDEQRLREELQSAVPDPPDQSGRGDAARARSRADRRRREALTGGLVVALLLATTTVWATHRPDRVPPVTGSGPAVCHRFAATGKGARYVDSRQVDGVTAAAWLRSVAPNVDAAAFRDDRRVTVCVTRTGLVPSVWVIGDTGHLVLIPRGDLVIPSAMTILDRLWTGGASTTDAPFTCDGPPTRRYPDVTSTLPSGATAARICFDGLFFTPPQVLLHGVDSLVAAVNAAPIGYVSPDSNCSVAEGDYGYRIVFRYPSGTRSVSVEPCRGLEVGLVTRPSGHLDLSFMSLLRKQVGSTGTSATAPPCPASASDRPAGVGDIRNVVAARYCTTPGGAGRVLTAGELRFLRSWGRGWLGAGTEPDNVCPRPPAGWPRVSLTDAWGDRFSLVLVGCATRPFPAVVDVGAPQRVSYPLSTHGRAYLHLLRQLKR
jgi:hypothetical protein